jgi:hypothetical protein
MKLDGKGDMPGRGDKGPMADQRHAHADKRASAASHEKRERELDAWMDRALGVRKPDPEPIVRDL